MAEPTVIATRQQIETRLAAKYQMMAERIVDSISDEDLLKASLQQKAISSACMIDKARLITGLSTSNSSIHIQALQDADEPD